MFVTSSVWAQAPDARIIKVINPSISNSIQVGGMLNRTVEIEMSSPYQVSKTALPMKGVTRNGIELADIAVKTSGYGSKNIYTIALRYQVFASAPKPVVMQLPEEQFVLTGGAEAISLKVPVWSFWFSPLVAEGISNAKENMQPQYKATLIDVGPHLARLWLSFGLLVAGLIGLVYINADKRWLPFMNGTFAQAHRSLKKLPRNPEGERVALVNLHQAFNQVYGANLFASEIEQFLAAHPKFIKLKDDIQAFFERSNISLFAGQHPGNAQYIDSLVVFSKSLRDCERGI